MDICENVETIIGGLTINYYKSKKTGFVSPRDQITLNSVYYKEHTKHKREMILVGQSVDLKKYPPKSGIVRATSYISGYHLVEHRGPDGIWTDVNFITEGDPKIS